MTETESPRGPAAARQNWAYPRRSNTWEPASKREIWAVTAYFVGLVSVSDILNVRLGIEAMTLATLFAAICITMRLRAFLRDWWFLLIGLVLWNVSGPIAAFSPMAHHLTFMMNTDRLLGLGRQPVQVIQQHLAVQGHITIVDILTFVTYNLHVPEPYVAGYILWRLNRLAYLRFAASALVLLVVGFLAFVIFPAVPPWMAAQQGALPGVYNGFGVVLRHHPLPFHGTPLFYFFHWRGDAVAAFPSEHAAFPMLEFLAFSQIARWGKWLLVWVVWVLFVIVYLGEHWITDGLAGWLLALICYLFVLRTTVPAAFSPTNSSGLRTGASQSG